MGNLIDSRLVVAVRNNCGRLFIMANGSYLTVVASFSSGAKSGYLTAGGLMMVLGGYLAPSIKMIVLKIVGLEATIVTHEKEKRTEAGVNLSDELESGSAVEIDESEAVETARFVAASEALTRILTSELALKNCKIHLYLYDADVDRLVPTQFESNDDVLDQEAWKPGEGVTGMAYSTRSLQIWDKSQPQILDSVRQQIHQDLVAVAAAPILNNAQRVIGVLTASERNVEVEHSVLRSEVGQYELIQRGTLVARVLVDLLGWITDDE